MSQPGQYPDAPRRGPEPVATPSPASGTDRGGARLSFRAVILALAATAAASALLGLLVGLAWAALAPKALLVVQSRGVASVVDPETSAFIEADAWFCLLTAAAGLICGLAGYVLAVRRYGAIAVTGLVLGGVGGSLLAIWIGQRQGLAGFRSLLATSPPGTQLHDPLTLGAHGAIAFWPLLTALVIGTAEIIVQAWQHRRDLSAARVPAITAPAAEGERGAGSHPGF